MQSIQQTKTITRIKLTELNYSPPLPKSWTKAAGILSGKRAALERHLKKIRLEWSKSHS